MAISLRSVLFVPTANPKALARAPGLNADAVILDLEDAVSASEKDEARASALRALRLERWKAPLRAVRINALNTGWAEADLLAFAPAEVDVLVIPKVENAAMLQNARAIMARAALVPGRPLPALWAMVETPRGVLNLKDIAASAARTGLTTLIAGTNDLAKGLGCDGLKNDREALISHLSAIVLAARGYGLMALDGVYNAFGNEKGFAREARQGKQFGYNGKTLIHPSQIEPANVIFGPSEAVIKRAKAIIRAFKLKNNAGKGVISLDGEMVERLHLHDAQALLDSLPVLSAKPSSPASSRKGKKPS
ncbi:MAG: CoA ester lyase [Robiginitomaculum sp.]|nr:MAG: CoA ester lyase [Robiginitomaculum sp.]